MSEKKREIEEEEEIIDHWSHEHPLTLAETRREDKCYSCESRFGSGEQGYGCSKKCGYTKLLHEECAKMATKIRHPLHPQHILIQQHEPNLYRCDVCKRLIWSIGYKCTSSECEFQMHTRCAQASGVIDAADDDDEQSRRVIHHPSHPKHDLRLLSRNCSCKCDACGTIQKGNSYLCIACQYWIHERCASLPQTIKREDHYHSLSLSFHLPLEYIIFDYKCDVCYESLLPKYWIYHCELCRYIVHIKCAFKKPPHPTTYLNNGNGKCIIRFPVNDVAEEQIRPFVMRHGGAIPIPPIIPHDEEKYDFLHHKHPLTLISSSTHDDQNQEEEEDDYGKRSELICDACITPIFSLSSSSFSSSDKYYYYMSCSECKYYLHLACFHLPHKLPSLPLLHDADHELLLQSSSDKLKPWECQFCSVCYPETNGLFYACTRCDDFRADIKCASMPDTIYHAAHPQHLLNLLSKEGFLRGNYPISLSCAADCGYHPRRYNCYACDGCEFVLHVACAVLPASTTSRRWDKHHPLKLTHDATLNHPGDFYCDHCEKQMNPKSWMYHCRHCDLSFHPACFLTTSGEYRNIKLGQQYVNGAAHPHPLTYQLLTTKRRCDICGVYSLESPGFHCASCNFFICLYECSERVLRDGDSQAVD